MIDEKSIEEIPILGIRYESLLAELVDKEEIRLDEIVVAMQGIFNRAHRKDVLGIDFVEGEKNHKDYIEVKVSREGLYDTIPEALFHQAKGRKGFKDVNDMIDESKMTRKEERDARLFFQPLEQEFSRKRIEIELEERRLLDHFANEFLDNVYGTTDFEDLPPISKNNLFYLLPLAQRIVGNTQLTEQAISAIIKENVQIILKNNNQMEEVDFMRHGLGEVRLGVDLICSSTINDGIPSWEVAVGPIDLANLPNYLEKGSGRKLLDIVEGFFFPLECVVNWYILLKNEEESFTLSGNEYHSRLGYSTIIC